MSYFLRYVGSASGQEEAWKGISGLGYSANYVYDTGSLTWIPQVPATGGVGGSVTVSNFPAIQAVSQSGTWSMGRTWSLGSSTDSVNVGNFPTSQAVSIAAPVAVTGPLTDTQLRATPVPVSGTVSANISGAVSQSGVWSVGRTWALGSGTDSVTVSGTVAVSNSVAVTGPLTDVQMRASSGTTLEKILGQQIANTLLLTKLVYQMAILTGNLPEDNILDPSLY